MEIFGKPAISPFIYFTGKFSAYLVWAALLFEFAGVKIRVTPIPSWLQWLSIFLAILGGLYALAAMKDLGGSLRFGLPVTRTEFKSGGLYAVSRNPIYLGFFIVTAAAMIYTFNPFVILLGIYGIYTHHKITLSEEAFLRERFGGQYIEYCQKVRRYI
jgi:protein-S-isoprenylcysteine O-methyltransferase Ste14